MKRLVFLSLSLLLLLILIPSCITVPAPSPNPIPPVETPPVIMEFSSNPSTINSGGTSTLLWNVTGATSVSIDQGIGQVDVAGTRVVSPAKSAVYTISATNPAGTVIRSSAIIIVSAPAPVPAPPQTTASNPVISFTTSYLGGTSWQLNWNVSNATQIAIRPDIGPVNPTGSTVVTIHPQDKLNSIQVGGSKRLGMGLLGSRYGIPLNTSHIYFVVRTAIGRG